MVYAKTQTPKTKEFLNIMSNLMNYQGQDFETNCNTTIAVVDFLLHVSSMSKIIACFG
ncbi:hypothetical protein ACEW7V_02315 [Areca yellow leaf disease phytoplasma]|uniref:hypothetical protein n=1 Tax=Areca yellow leaf disease phytoplasma TaxID=927614 RepID=UPI0035B50AA3